MRLRGRGRARAARRGAAPSTPRRGATHPLLARLALRAGVHAAVRPRGARLDRGLRRARLGLLHRVACAGRAQSVSEESSRERERESRASDGASSGRAAAAGSAGARTRRGGAIRALCASEARAATASTRDGVRAASHHSRRRARTAGGARGGARAGGRVPGGRSGADTEGTTERQLLHDPTTRDARGAKRSPFFSPKRIPVCTAPETILAASTRVVFLLPS